MPRISSSDLSAVLPEQSSEEFKAVIIQEDPKNVEELTEPASTEVPQLASETIFVQDEPGYWRRLSPEEDLPEEIEPAPPPPEEPVRQLWVKRGENNALNVHIHPGTRITIEGEWEIDNPKEIDESTADEFLSFLLASDVVLHRGSDLPEAWMKVIKNNKDISYVRVSSRSANKKYEQIRTAAILGDKRLDPQKTIIFSGLPKVQGFFRSLVELWRMGLELGQREGWQKVNEELRNRVRLLAGRPAISNLTKENFVNELLRGQNNVVVLIAHNKDKRIYLGGLNGEFISFDEIGSLKRDIAPNRMVVLITCSAGSVNDESTSLAEIMLKNKLARTVFASPTDVDATGVPELVEQLVVSPTLSVRERLQTEGYIQIVNLRELFMLTPHG
jgi:hypothetical protein